MFSWFVSKKTELLPSNRLFLLRVIYVTVSRKSVKSRFVWTFQLKYLLMSFIILIYDKDELLKLTWAVYISYIYMFFTGKKQTWLNSTVFRWKRMIYIISPRPFSLSSLWDLLLEMHVYIFVFLLKCVLSQVSLNGDYIIILKKLNKKKDVNWLFSAKLPPPHSSNPPPLLSPLSPVVNPLAVS